MKDGKYIQYLMNIQTILIKKADDVSSIDFLSSNSSLLIPWSGFRGSFPILNT